MASQSRHNFSQSQGGARSHLDLHALSASECFLEPNDEDVCLELTDVRLLDTTGRTHSSERTFSSLDALQAFTKYEAEHFYNIRIYSMCQPNSWEPLDISEKMVSEVLAHQNVPHEFLEVLRSFRSRTLSSEEAFCGHWFSKTSLTREEVSYSFKYPERRGRPSGEPWSIRQTGIYHSVNPQTHRSCWIVLNPMQESAAEVRLKSTLADKARTYELVSQPLEQHILLISTYFANWREYILHYEEELLTISQTIMGSRFDIKIRVSADTLTRVRFIEGRILPLVPIFRSYEETFAGLSNLNRALFAHQSISADLLAQMDCTIKNMTRQSAAYGRNSQFLLDKIASIAQLLSDVLALKNQHIAQDQSSHLFDLTTTSQSQNESICTMTQSTVQDSATIRVITVATLAFLPTTFVATLFGTQLFYLTPSHSLGVSPQIWILFALSIPLTALTIAFWLVRKKKHEVERRLMYESFHGRDCEKGK